MKNKIDKNEWLLLDNQLCFSLYSASRMITQSYTPFLEPLNLTYPQYLVMLVLWEDDNLSVKYLGNRLMLDSGTLSPLLKKLEFKGFVNRSRLPDDERVVMASLTKEGERLKKLAYPIPGKLFCKTKLQHKELTIVRETLQKLLQNINSGDNNEI